jgi:hypothetical protein
MAKSLAQLLVDMKAAKEAMKKLQGNIPRIIGNEAVKVIKQNFALQGYDSGAGVTAWPQRSPATNHRYNKRYGVKGSVYQSTNPLLKQTGILYNAIQYKIQGKLVYIGVDIGAVPYAEKMNTGGPGKWGKNATNTPARKYMPAKNEPPNTKMLRAIIKKIKSERDRALAPFKQ